MKRMKLVLAGMMASVCFAATSQADRRSYVWTYEYSTLPAGIAEAEYYVTAEVPDREISEVSVWQHQVEIEYGLTDNWDIGLYQVWSQSSGTDSEESFNYEGFKVKSRYKLFRRGEFIVDPLIYVEYIRNADLSEPDALEGKLVLAKDIGKFNLAYNQIVEREFGGGGEVEHEYALGAGYDLSNGLKLGFESKGSYSEGECAVGPVISMETEKLWVSIGTAFGLNKATDDLQARMIMGFAF